MPAGHGSSGVSGVNNVANAWLSDQVSLSGVASSIDSADVAGAQAIPSVDPSRHVGASVGTAEHNASGYADSISGSLPDAPA